MGSRISEEGLIDKAMRFLSSDVDEKALRYLVREALIKADRELRECDQFSPLAWDIVTFDGLRTVPYAYISAITQADPGVITADNIDSDIDGHGFHDESTYGHQDIVRIASIYGMEELNERVFLLVYIDEDTFSLKTIDGADAVDTTNYTEYSSSGVVYHAGFLLSTTNILANVDNKWTLKRLINSPRFDGYSTDPITELAINEDPRWINTSYSGRPRRWHYWQHHKTATASPSISHYLFWYPPVNTQFNLEFPYQKEIADMSSWNSTSFPFHPAEVHDAIWHGALAHLVGDAKRMERQSKDKGHVTKVEILFAEKWLREWEADKKRVRRFSRSLLGARGGSGGLRA